MNLEPIDYEENIIQKPDDNCAADIGFSFAAILSLRDSGLFQIIIADPDSH